MRKVLLAVSCLLCCVVGVWLLTGAKKETYKPTSVLIVKEPMHSQEGIARPETISIVDEEKIEQLEAFFPQYASHPSSNTAAGWKAGYRVYFNFPLGRTTCVTLSGNDNGQTWSTGNGDFRTRGDFEKFVAGLPVPLER